MPLDMINVGSLASNYWITDNIRDFGKLTDEALKADGVKGDSTRIGEGGVGEVDRAAEDAKVLGPAITRDSMISSIAAKGGGNPLKNVDGQVKLLSYGLDAKRMSDDDLKAEGAKNFQRLGLDTVSTFDHAIDVAVRMNRLYMENRPKGEITADERQNAMRTLSNVLKAGDFAKLTGSTSIGKDGFKALLNATLGVMKACRDNDVTAESVLSVQQGKTYDLAKGADVLKLAVESARQARERFVDEANLKAILDRPEVKNLDAESFKKIEKNVNWIISVRKQLSASLDIKFDIADALKAKTEIGRKRAIDAKVRDAGNALRTFRYELDGFTGRLSQAEVMSKLRRSCDNASGRIWRAQTPRLPAGLYEALKNTEADLAKQLDHVQVEGGDAEAGITFESAADASKAASDLTHEVNNAIRYHFSGREQKIDAFAKKMHEMLDPLMEKGGSREVTFEAGADAKIGIETKLTDLTKLSVTAGATGTHRAKITVAPGGGITVTYFNGGSVSANATAKFAPATAKAGVAIGGGKDKSFTYRSLDDFIRDAGGESILAGSANGSRYCLGMIGGFFRKIGHGLTMAATAIGLRNHHSAIQMGKLRQQLTDNHVVDSLDNIFAATKSGHAVKTVIKTNNEVFGSLDLSADFKFGPKYNETDKSFGAGAKLSGSFKKEGKVTSENFRSFVDSVKLQSDAWLDKKIAAMEKSNPSLFAAFTAAKGQPKAQLAALTDALRRTENAIAHSDDEWKTIASSYRDFAMLLVRAGREDLDDDTRNVIDTMLEPRIRSPRADIPEEIFQASMVEKTGESHSAKTTYDLSVKFTYDIGASALEDMASKATGLSDDASKLSLKGLGADAGLDAANTAVKTGVEKLAGLKGSLNGSIHVENKDGKGAHVTEMSTEVTNNMPMGAFANWVAKQCVDADETIPKDKKESFAAKMAKDISTTMVKSFATDIALDEFKKLTFDQAMSALKKSGHEKVADFIGAMFKKDATEGLEKSFEKTSTKLFKFSFDKGRVTQFSIVDKNTTTGTLGIRFEVAPAVSAGFHITEKYSETKTVASILERPNLGTILKPVGDFMASGAKIQLHNFIIHNRKGVERLGKLMAGVLPEGGDRYPEDGLEAREKLDTLEADLKEADTEELAEKFSDRIRHLRADLAEARKAQASIDWSNESNAETNLSAMEKLFVLNVTGNNLLDEIKAAKEAA